MAAEHSDAIVLRVVPFSETSVVVTLLTRDFGRTTGLAKGAYRPKGPFEGALDLLSVCRVTLIRKEGSALDILTEAKLERRFRAAGRDLPRLYAAYYVIELLRELAHEGDPHPELYALTERTLAELDGSGEIAAVLAWFEMQTLQILGLALRLDRCAACGRELPETGRASLGLLAGGVLCGRCREAQRQVVSISADLRAALVELTRAVPAGERRAIPSLDAAVRGEYRGVINRYFTHVLGHRLRMPRFLGVAAG